MADASLIAATMALGLLGILLFVILLRRMTPKQSVPQPPSKAAAATKTAPKKPEVIEMSFTSLLGREL